MKQPPTGTYERLCRIYPVSRETFSRLEIYCGLLVQWQAKTNLVAPSTLPHFWDRHVADSLQLLALKPDAANWTDIGSGGGFPGMVLAIVLSEAREAGKPQANVILVEAIRKKCAFLRRVAIETGITCEVHDIRIESATKQLQQADVITARALASLEKLLEFTGEHLSGGRVALFHKGRDYEREIAECRGKWTFDLVVHPSLVDADSVVLEVANARRG